MCPEHVSFLSCRHVSFLTCVLPQLSTCVLQESGHIMCLPQAQAHACLQSCTMELLCVLRCRRREQRTEQHSPLVDVLFLVVDVLCCSWRSSQFKNRSVSPPLSVVGCQFFLTLLIKNRGAVVSCLIWRRTGYGTVRRTGQITFYQYVKLAC